MCVASTNPVLQRNRASNRGAGAAVFPPFENISNPDQVLTKKELAKYLGAEERGGNGDRRAILCEL